MVLDLVNWNCGSFMAPDNNMSYTASRWMVPRLVRRLVKFDCRETYPPIMSHENLRDVSFTTNQSSTKK
ncbi:hypothetical protein BLOT_012668, partial [Blomia tropicalis]